LFHHRDAACAERMKGKNKMWFCHVLNPLHVYCRLRDLGLEKRDAIWCARHYERALKWIKGFFLQ